MHERIPAAAYEVSMIFLSRNIVLQHTVLSWLIAFTSAATLLGSPDQLDWSSAQLVQTNTSLNEIPDDFSIYTIWSEKDLKSLSCFMNSINALALLGPQPFDGVESKRSFSYPSYTDMRIDINPIGERIERRFVIWGLAQAISCLSTTHPLHQFKQSQFRLSWKGASVGYISYNPNSASTLLESWGKESNEMAQALQARTVIVRADEPSPSNPPQIGNDTIIVGDITSNFLPEFKTQRLSSTAYFDIIAFAICAFAEFDPNKRNLPYILNDNELHVSIAAAEIPSTRPRPARRFTNGWVIYACLKAAEAGAAYWRQKALLVEMSGTLAFSSGDGQPYINAGLLKVVNI